VRFLDLFLELVPESVVSGWMEGNSGHGRRVLEGYLGILSAGTKYGGAEGKKLHKSLSNIRNLSFPKVRHRQHRLLV
jgi:pre-rRNA-processing protein IPI1